MRRLAVERLADAAPWHCWRQGHRWWPCVTRGRVRMRLAYRAGWPDRQGREPVRVVNRGGWLRVGPWVLGNTDAWDRSEAP